MKNKLYKIGAVGLGQTSHAANEIENCLVKLIGDLEESRHLFFNKKSS